jgi:hypothetical protein
MQRGMVLLLVALAVAALVRAGSSSRPVPAVAWSSTA